MSNSSSLLHTPVRLGALQLRNRIIMSPLTRRRVDAEFLPEDIIATYYEQRCSAGLIITESMATAPYGEGYGILPGLFNARQQAAWARIVEAVHAKGGLLVAQLFHPGRARTDGEGKVGTWAVNDPLLPGELTAAEIVQIRQDYVDSAKRARDAGFDGVEVHSGTGLMIDRFLRPGTNHRRDSHGGSTENRIRLHLEIFEAIARNWPLDRIGIKLAPSALVNGAPDPHREETFALLLERMNGLKLAYAHFTRVTPEEANNGYGPGVSLEWLRNHYRGPLLAVNGFTRDEAEATLRAGIADAIVFGRDFISNPDLVQRFARGAPIAKADPATYYTPGPVGLIDYPPYDG